MENAYFKMIPSFRLENNALVSGFIGMTSATSASSFNFSFIILAKHFFSSLQKAFFGSRPLFLQKISEQKSRLRFGFSVRISTGVMNLGTPNEAASLITLSALSSSLFSSPDLSH